MGSMRLEGTIVGVDLDGVCSDFYGRMREIAAEWLERPLDDLTTDVSYELREWGIDKPDQYESLHRFAVTQRQLFETSPMIPGARLYLRKLSGASASSPIGYSFTTSTISRSARPSTGSIPTASRTGISVS